jgi:hypothetical protein
VGVELPVALTADDALNPEVMKNGSVTIMGILRGVEGSHLAAYRIL